MKCNSEVHLQNKDKVFLVFFQPRESLARFNLILKFFPKDIEFVIPTVYFLNSGIHHKKTYSALYHFSLVAFEIKHAFISVSSKSLL